MKNEKEVRVARHFSSTPDVLNTLSQGPTARVAVEWDNAQHFLLQQQSISVAQLAAGEDASWLDSTIGLDILNTNARDGHQEFDLPGSASFVRVHATFSWAPSGGHPQPPSPKVLEVTQLFTVQNRTIVPTSWTASGMGAGPAIPGCHPLVSVKGLTVGISTTFVDVTYLTPRG